MYDIITEYIPNPFLFNDQIVVKEPHEEFDFEPHRDNQYGPYPNDETLLTINCMLVLDNFTNEKATVNVVDFTNIKSDKLTLYNDILFSEKEGDNGLGIRSQFTYQPTPLVRRSGSILYFEDSFKLNDFGYLKKADWFHFGIGSDLTKINFKESSPIKERKIGIDFNYDSDTSGNSNPIQLRQEYNYKYKNTSAFQASWDLKTSGKNTTIT